MQDKRETGVPAVYLSDLEKLVERTKKHVGEENVEISFEYILTALFPTSWNNIQAELSRQYTLGYIQGQKEMEAEIRMRAHARSESDCYCE
jgi:hypothetical protein